MVYTAPTAKTFRTKKGTLTEKLITEFSAIDTAIDNIIVGDVLQVSKFVDITASMVSSTSLAANGVDFASGTDATFYGVFFAPVNITMIAMRDYLTEAYVKEGSDAKITVTDGAGSPSTIFTRTLTAAGEAVKAVHTTLPEADVANIAAGERLDLCITHTDSSTGTGHAKIILEYIER
jgi:hypothetical protein